MYLPETIGYRLDVWIPSAIKKGEGPETHQVHTCILFRKDIILFPIDLMCGPLCHQEGKGTRVPPQLPGTYMHT